MPLKSRLSKLSSKVANQAIKGHLDRRASTTAVRDFLKDKGFKVSSSKKGFLASGATEKDVERALDELGKAEKKFLSFSSRESDYKRTQGLRRTFREVEKLDKKDALRYFQLGKEKFQKIQTQAESSQEKPEELNHLQQRIESSKRLGPSQEQKVRALQRQADKLTADWLRKKDPTGKEAAKFLRSKTPIPAEEYKTIQSEQTKKSTPENPSAPIDPLGPDT